jgi:hypothetical protein
MADAFGASAPPDTMPASPADPTTRLLFFDGGSRGNVGPGGAGAVIVEVDPDAIHPRVLWSACMAYGQSLMTNNRAEYLDLIAGLREACRHGWSAEVIGDSALIIRQLSRFLPRSTLCSALPTARHAGLLMSLGSPYGTIIGATTIEWRTLPRTRP